MAGLVLGARVGNKVLGNKGGGVLESRVGVATGLDGAGIRAQPGSCNMSTMRRDCHVTLWSRSVAVMQHHDNVA